MVSNWGKNCGYVRAAYSTRRRNGGQILFYKYLEKLKMTNTFIYFL